MTITIAWLNSDYTEAVITRGLIWKEQAHVCRVFDQRLINGAPQWLFKSTQRSVGWLVNSQLESWRSFHRTAGREWIPVAPMPQARLIERKP